MRPCYHYRAEYQHFTKENQTLSVLAQGSVLVVVVVVVIVIVVVVLFFHKILNLE